mmetsp:Transcript_62334/g.123208  ORF Transcript_62334/g.123208 Transcript_62334/m.123208 type:complete len:89 (-) Transcript_62334:47-313(-)
MSRPVAVTDGADMEQVAQLMLKRRFNHVPVVDDAGRLQGILTSQDVLRHVLLRMGGDVPMPDKAKTSKRQRVFGLLGMLKRRIMSREA